MYQHVCLSSTLKRPKTMPREKSNLSTLRLKILRYLVWTIENGGFQKRAQKMCHIQSVPSAFPGVLLWIILVENASSQGLRSHRWFKCCHVITVTAVFTRWRHAPQQIAIPFAVSIFGGFCFWWFRRDSPHVTPQTSSTIRHNIEIFHEMLSDLLFS